MKNFSSFCFIFFFPTLFKVFCICIRCQIQMPSLVSLRCFISLIKVALYVSITCFGGRMVVICEKYLSYYS